MVPSAKEMASAITVVAGKLLDVGVLEQDSWGTMQKLVSDLRKQGEGNKWRYSVDRTVGFAFRALSDDRKDVYTPVVSIDGIVVDESIKGIPPISKLDASLELRYTHAVQRIYRWHFDLANSKEGATQPGPLYHLQFGGHAHLDRALDMPISAPRWLHPPMDLLLILEAVTANFYPAEWENLRDDRQWCGHIQIAQKLCLTHYAEKLRSHLQASHSTILGACWADRWKS